MKIQFFSFSGIILTFLMSYMISSSMTSNAVTTTEKPIPIEETSTKQYFEMPIGNEQWTKAEFTDYIDNLTPEVESELIKSHHVKSYLQAINKYDDVVKDMTKGSLFSQVELSTYLSKKQIVEMSSFKFNSANSSSFGCQNVMLSCVAAGTACTSTTRYIQTWYNCWLCYTYRICRSSCGGPF